MDMMMSSSQNMHQAYMQQQPHYNMPQHQQQQHQQHLGYYDNQMQDQCMMYQNNSPVTGSVDNGYTHPSNDLSMTKRYRTDSVQLLRCRRRMDLARLQHSFKSHPTAVARRNERERNRVKHINSTFTNLRHHLPTAAKSKKMSKVDTLRSAIRYIKHLQTILQDSPTCDNDVSTTQLLQCPLSPGSSSSSESMKSGPATPNTCRTGSPSHCGSLQDGSSPEQDLMSPAGRDALSPCTESTSQGSPCQRSSSPYGSDDPGYETLETAADDLADLVDWFQ